MAVSGRFQERSQFGERALPKRLMPGELIRGGERGVTQFENAAAKIAAQPEIDQAFGAVPLGSLSPEQAHLPPVAVNIGTGDANGGAARREVIEAITIGIR